jgi:hypothetical protein
MRDRRWLYSEHSRSGYGPGTVLRSRLVDFVHPSYNQGRAKLVCDDLNMKNVILEPIDDPAFPAFAGLVDLEFTYGAPAQLAAMIPCSCEALGGSSR